jgi:DNA repair exonuclease SbcCD nuclease subunit
MCGVQYHQMIKQSKIAMFSDLHLGIYGNSERWHDTALKWADWMVDELTKKNIVDVFFLGDFFDNRTEISVQTIHVAAQIIEKFKNFNMFMIIGNHDAYYKNRSDVHSLGMVKGHKNITLVDKILEFESFDKKLLMVPWNNDLPDAKYDYIFGHFEIQTFKMNNFTVCSHGLSPNDLLSKTKNAFSGHFHNRNSKKYSEGAINYIGSCFSMDFSDVGNTVGYHILDIKDGSIEFIENSVSPSFIKLYISTIKTLNSDLVGNNVVKLVIDKEIDDKKLEKLQLAIGKLSPWQFTTEHNVSSKTLEDVEVIDSINITEMFEEFYEKLGLEDKQLERVKAINEDLYKRNKI